jgi:hypothetical protein
MEVTWFYAISDVLDHIAEKKSDPKLIKSKKRELRNRM